MFRIEKKLWDVIEENSLMVVICAATLISFLSRYGMRNYISRDMSNCLIPWYESIKSMGGVFALKGLVGNYNIPYQTLIAILTYIPIAPEYLYKISSSVFDYLQAFLVLKIVLQLSKNKWLAIIGFIAAINLPIVLLNSALWGQCDSIYTFFCILSFYLCLNEKYYGTFIAAGAAFAFKLQTIFYMPFLFFLYIYLKKFNVLHFILIPFTMIGLSLGGIIQGQRVSAVFDIYVQQTKNGNMSVNYPSLWAVIIPNYKEEYYTDMRIYGILLAFLVLIVFMMLLLHNKEMKKFSFTELLEIDFLFVYTCVFFLPNMHERYGYSYIILGLMIALLDKRLSVTYLALMVIDMVIYANYLFGLTPNWQVMAIINLSCYCACVYLIMKRCLLADNDEEPMIY